MASSTVLMGVAASPGITVGRCWPLDRRRMRTPRRTVAEGEVEGELSRFKAAVDAADEQLAEVRTKVERLEGTEHLVILDLHRMMLRDEMLASEAQRLIRGERVNAEWAVKRAVRKIKGSFSERADPYFKERRSDVDFVGERIIKNLMGQPSGAQERPPEGSIIVARDLSPADTALLLHECKVAAFVTDVGARNSHTAIVARALEIPAVVSVGRASSAVARGDWMVVDGGRGVVIVNPTPEERADYEALRERWLEGERALLSEVHLPATTRDGVSVRLTGNIEFAEEVESLLAHGGEGVGLYRTEFLYMGQGGLPSEEEHYQTYRRILSAMGGRPVTIRTLDLGADKLPAGQRTHDENPALGLRAVRYGLRHPELFRTQLRGLLRAARHGPLRVMFPMVSGLVELRAAKRALAEAQEELRGEGIETELPPVGIMVELPSAAVIADRLAAECAFFSIGTNDLIQYTMAIDRQNKEVSYLYRPLHLAVLRLLRQTCDAARAAGIPVSMCGEMAGEPTYALVLLGLGLTELSMNGPSIPLVKRLLRAARAEDGQRLVERLLCLGTADELEREVEREMKLRFPGLLPA